MTLPVFAATFEQILAIHASRYLSVFPFRDGELHSLYASDATGGDSVRPTAKPRRIYEHVLSDPHWYEIAKMRRQYVLFHGPNEVQRRWGRCVKRAVLWLRKNRPPGLWLVQCDTEPAMLINEEWYVLPILSDPVRPISATP